MTRFLSLTFLTKHGYLLLLFPPIFVYILATILFDLSLNQCHPAAGYLSSQAPSFAE